jgi:hypothetical protein
MVAGGTKQQALQVPSAPRQAAEAAGCPPVLVSERHPLIDAVQALLSEPVGAPLR